MQVKWIVDKYISAKLRDKETIEWFRKNGLEHLLEDV